MAKINIGHELKYWLRQKNKPYKRAAKILETFQISTNTESIADIGCGPFAGIFYANCNWKYMYAVDLLWKYYFEKKIAIVPKKVKIIKASAEKFKLPELVDCAISVNALDHSGSLKKSILNIMANIKIGGYLYFHVHMRSKKQLNKGHQMLIKEKDIDGIFFDYEIVYKIVFDKCPIEENKPYRSYVACVKK